ncbi:hypothetical protein KXX39_007697 [Aspergillus fumigatus]|nr:hypothetical protein KXX39_007697 [Aspergillus fumigatus]
MEESTSLHVCQYLAAVSLSEMTVIFPIQTRDQRAVLAVAFTFSILAVVAVSLRLLAHHIAHKPWTASDYFLIAACFFAVGLQSISITGVFQAGIGFDHMTSIISILLLYLRIFPVVSVVRVAWATIGVIVAWAIATILAGCLICRPFAFNWDQTIPGGSCGDQVTSFTATGVINLVTDVVVLVTPMPSLYRLQMATYKKVTLITVFGLGVVTCVISALRISVLSSMDFTDITYTIPRANIFSGLEPCLAVVLASVPMMRPLLGRSVYTPNGTGPKSSAPSAGPKADAPAPGDGFQRLGDNSSQLCLQPLGQKKFGVGVPEEVSLSGGSEESLTFETRRQRERALG